ncbi:lipocalin family protein [Sphingobacterium psychroaquaticum]|uniref:Apolipoprotein D and lipocalin family protein n=1 Tax=Sphingobacterium psychroaquaticum TaxID=561061 RepID=A0A1X7JP04_9SPHI|nr:lipocalin family protein [Sphingobacterium psychroaquaticum]QBQ40860.1 lipocalin [Sphingobacterium psychroaquaticum]SMG29402.1 apolipoprotein D and lipocalin family protein [Sphingobacterium psychroaquaticum]
MDNKKKSLLLLTAVAAGTALYSILKPVKSAVVVVPDFDMERFVGEWYEIARLDTKWSRNLKNVLLSLAWNDDDSLRLNIQGYDMVQEKYRQRIGRLRYLDDRESGALKVSYINPFYMGYNIVSVDGDYSQVLVFGQNLDYMCILSREKKIPEALREQYLQYAEESGYALEALVWTVQD